MTNVRRPRRPGQETPTSSLTPASREEWLAHLRTALADADSVTRDMLRLPRDRELGPAYHRDLYEEASGKITARLAHAPAEGNTAAP